MTERFPFNPFNWYYFATDTAPATNVWASARGVFVNPTTDAGYLAFVAAGGVAPTYATAVAVYAAIAKIAKDISRPQYLAQTISASPTSLANPLAYYIELDNTTGAEAIVKLPQANLPTSIPLGTVLRIKNVSTGTVNTIALQRSDATALIFIAVDDYIDVITTSFATTTGLQATSHIFAGFSSGAAYFKTFNNAIALRGTGSLTNGQIVVGQTGADPLNKAVSGDATLSSTGTLTLVTSPLPLTGGQIAFPATQSASADANTLDDYEENTWTPAITFATPGDLSVAYTTQEGVYTKIGRQVTLLFNIVTSSFTWATASGALRITGNSLTNGSVRTRGAITVSGITKATYTDFTCSIAASATDIGVSGSGSAVANSAVVAADMPTAGSVILIGSITYFV